MRRFWIDPSFVVGNEVHITGDLVNHIIRVCRFEVGAKFEVLCEGHRALLIELIETSKTKVSGKILSERVIPELSKPHIVMAVSVPKPQKLELIIQKSVELGVKRIVPFFSDYSFFRNSEKISDKKQDRWGKIITAATQQSGRGDLMEISAPEHLDKVLDKFNQTNPAKGLFMYEGQCDLSLREALKQLKTEETAEVWCFVGSEGGFSINEREKFIESKLEPIHMGDQILRVETACLSLASILKYEFQA